MLPCRWICGHADLAQLSPRRARTVSNLEAKKCIRSRNSTTLPLNPILGTCFLQARARETTGNQHARRAFKAVGSLKTGFRRYCAFAVVHLEQPHRTAMPFLSKDEFEQWTGSSFLWQRVNISGAFIGLRYRGAEVCQRLRTLRGASPLKYRIIAEVGDARVLVARTNDDGEFLDMLKRLLSLTTSDVMQEASSDMKDMLERLIEIARTRDVAADTADTNPSQQVSLEMLERISSLEVKNAALEEKLREKERALKAKDEEKEQVQEDVQVANANQALAQLTEDMKTMKDEAPSPSSPSTSSTVAVSNQSPGHSTEGSNADDAEVRQLEGMSFPEKLMHGPFGRSLAKEFLQLASAPYQANSLLEHVACNGKLWQVIVADVVTNMLAVGRRVEVNGKIILEVGFRGAVTEDAYGDPDCANWFSNLHLASAALQSLDGNLGDVLVHKGFQNVFLAVMPDVMKWLQNNSSAGPPCVRIAGHSLGGALALFSAIELKRSDWEIDGVVTFGCPRVGKTGFQSFYKDLELHHCTVQFANKCDPVPWVPWYFEHAMENWILGSNGVGAPDSKSHSMTGSAKSYSDTLLGAVDNRQGQKQHLALRGANAMVKYRGYASTVVSSIAPGGLVAQAAGLIPARQAPNVADQMHQQQLKVDIAMLKQDIGNLSKDMVKAIKELQDRVRQVQQWEWLLDMDTLIQIITSYQSQLQTWEQGAPGWFFKYKIQLNRTLAAANMELNDRSSQLAIPFVKLYLRGARFLIGAMSSSGALQENVAEEFQDISRSAKDFFPKCFQLKLEVPVLHEIVRLLPSYDDLALPGSRLQLQDRSNHHLDVKIVNEETVNLLQKLPDNMWKMLTSLQLDFSGCKQIADEHVEQLSNTLPQHITSLDLNFAGCSLLTDAAVAHVTSMMPNLNSSVSLNFSGCKQITDVAVAELAKNMSQSLALSLTLSFTGCEQITDAAVEELARKMPQGLTSSLNLGFHGCRQITIAAVAELAKHMPQSLASSLTLDFTDCEQITDAAVKKLARKMPQGLTSSLSLGFHGCRQITGAAVTELAKHMPQSLTSSLSLNFSGCEEITGAAVEELARKMPQGLTSSLNLGFHGCRQITGAAVTELAKHMPQSLTSSLSLNFSGCEEITGAAVEELARKMPQGLTSSLNLGFRGCRQITGAAVAELAKYMPQRLTLSLSLNFSGCKQITDAAVAELANNMAQSLASSLTLDFTGCGRITDEAVAQLARAMPQGLTSSLGLGFCGCEQITVAAVEALARTMPQSLTTSFYLNFTGCDQITGDQFSTIEALLRDRLSMNIGRYFPLMVTGEPKE